MSLESFVKTGVAVLDSLTGTEENLKAPWSLASGANNIGKRTLTGATTQTEKKQGGAVWGGAYVKNAQFLVGGKLNVLPAEVGQVVNLIMGLEGGTDCEVFFVQESLIQAYIGLEYEGVEIAGGKEKTWAVGDSWYLVSYENKMNVCRITLAGAYSVLYSALGSNTKKGIEPRWIFEPLSTKSSTAFRLTEFKAGGEAEAPGTANLSMVI